MADNFLEKQMADYLRARPRPQRRPSQPPRRVRVPAIPDAEVTEAIVRALRAEGFAVDFTLGDIRRGNAIAQSAGARYIPPYAIKTSL